MHKRLMWGAVQLAASMIALGLGWFAHVALLPAPGTALAGQAAASALGVRSAQDSGMLPAAPTSATGAHFTYQGRLTTRSGTAINTPVSVQFRIYDDADQPLWTSAVRTITPTNGLFTVVLGDDPDPEFYAYNLAQPASIGVTVVGDTEMLPHQPLHTLIGHGAGIGQPGVYGSSQTDSGVIGASYTATGVYGASDHGYGVLGFSNTGTGLKGVGGNSVGVEALTGNAGTPALRVQAAAPSGIALDIYTGTIQVTGAGLGSKTPVFIHQVHTGGGGNVCASKNYATVIDNPSTNGQPGAVVIVTPNYGPDSGGVAPAVGIPAVFYDTSNQCGQGVGRWVIYNLNSVAQPNNAMFNVLVVMP